MQKSRDAGLCVRGRTEPERSSEEPRPSDHPVPGSEWDPALPAAARRTQHGHLPGNNKTHCTLKALAFHDIYTT